MAGLSRIAQLPELVVPRHRSVSLVPGREAVRGAWRRPWLLALVTALASSALMFWRIGTPALWRDEAATTVAQQRSWAHLGQFFGGSEAPLVPYYALLKVLRRIILEIVPGLGAHPEILLRLPSAVAVVVTSTLLVHWLARAGQPTVAILSGSVFVLLSGTSRYAQEARPYALVLLLAMVATVLWWHLVQGRRWWILPYALVIAAMVALHALSATLVAGHLAAAVVLQPPASAFVAGRWGGWVGLMGRLSRQSRSGRLVRTAVGGLGGVVVASPLTLLAIEHGTGAKTQGNLSDALTVFLRLFNGQSELGQLVTVLLVALIVVLPLVAVATHWFSPACGDLVRLAACWAVVPLAVLLPAALARPNLIATRYILFVLPAWAMLAAFGLVAVARGTGRLVEQVDHRATSAVRGMVLTGAVLVMALIQLPFFNAVRLPGGHGEDVRPLLVVAERPEYQHLPIEVFPPSEAIQISAYSPLVMSRVINTRPSLTGPYIWSQRVSGEQVAAALKDAPGVVFIMRGGVTPAVPRMWDECRVVARGEADRRWSYVVVEPIAPEDGQAACTEL